VVSGSAEGRSKQVSHACSDVLRSRDARPETFFWAEAAPKLGCMPMTHTRARREMPCSKQRLGWAWRDVSERSRFGCRVLQAPSLYILPLALTPLASAFARRDASSWVSSCVREAAHTNFYPPTPPPGALEGVLVVLGGHTNHNRPRASLTKHSKDQCAYTWHVLVATQSVGRGKEQGSLKPVQRKHKRNSASLGPFASRRAKSGKEMRPECAGIDKGQRAWGPVLQGIFYKAI